MGLGNEATVGWLPFLSCRLLSFGSFTSFTRLFIARPKGLALGYSFASLSHKGFPIPSFTIVQSVIGLYLLNVHSLFVRSLLLLRVLTNTQCSFISFSRLSLFIILFIPSLTRPLGLVRSYITNLDLYIIPSFTIVQSVIICCSAIGIASLVFYYSFASLSHKFLYVRIRNELLQVSYSH